MADLTVKSTYSAMRAIAAMVLLFLVLGLLFANATSTSHELIEHTQHADGSHHPQSGDHDLEGFFADDLGAAGHSHEHDPSDHTHDIPLRFLLLAVASPAFLSNWEARPTAVLYSIPAFLLERPPKFTILA